MVSALDGVSGPELAFCDTDFGEVGAKVTIILNNKGILTVDRATLLRRPWVCFQIPAVSFKTGIDRAARRRSPPGEYLCTSLSGRLLPGAAGLRGAQPPRTPPPKLPESSVIE